MTYPQLFNATADHADRLAKALKSLRDIAWPDPACAEADAALEAWAQFTGDKGEGGKSHDDQN